MNSYEISKIDIICKKYNFKYDIFPYTCYITSQFHEWYFIHGGKGYILYHKNQNNYKQQSKQFNKKSENYHVQKDYYDIPYMLRAISQHDTYQIVKNDYRSTRMGRLYEQISKLG